MVVYEGYKAGSCELLGHVAVVRCVWHIYFIYIEYMYSVYTFDFIHLQRLLHTQTHPEIERYIV